MLSKKKKRLRVTTVPELDRVRETVYCLQRDFTTRPENEFTKISRNEP